MKQYQLKNFNTKKDSEIYLKQYEFFKTLFKQELLNNEFRGNQYIRVLAIDKQGKAFDSYYKDLTSLLDFISSNYKYQYNLYFNLSLTDGEGGRSSNLKNRTCIAFDFDKKDNLGLDHKEVLNRFEAAGLWYHALVDSGGGYHAYSIIESTNDYDSIAAAQQAYAKALKADLNAIKDTQVLRIPYTFNHKYDKPKMVNIIKLYTDNIKAYRLQDILRGSGQRLNDSNSRYIAATRAIPDCIEEIIRQGSKVGQRNEDLIKIIVTLRNRNVAESKIWHVIEEWDIKSGYSLDPEHNLEKEFDYIYKKHKNISLNCAACINKCSTHNMTILSENGDTIELTEKVGKRLREPKRANTKHLEANEVFIYSVLLIHNKTYIDLDKIKAEITYKDNQALSDKTIRTALEGLEHKGYILARRGSRNKLEVKPKAIRTDIARTFNVSIAAILEVVKGRITTEDYRVYLYMRQLRHEQSREEGIDLAANELVITQKELSKYFNVTERHMRRIIDTLESERLIDIIKQGKSKANGYTYNKYRLNY